ncbi:MAG: CHAT domain-containing protein [Okeania sp. SIO2G4]|uniref:CHAT domain-containing protein n=1 Tax=unclassified Okeania TaxID=2634635 RepID=UPI0013BD774F|nr:MULTISPECIES: CHAT domain-containing protein [unclassified Okeania]NEP39380.1 CHAT domain-containing protein [Okeania sp. SIO2H7]NEP75236.1 CHAT domain-containing protein [Okeania sp. SIO2G5]NEP96317.1 CHAT domain-containing protein [Okeania sp. SIO2F5]NEQ94031.1 CHAT domain-containing protein [Okeania sp. SIO2G4]
MINWKYFRLIISTACLLIIIPSIPVDKNFNLNSKAQAQVKTNSVSPILQNNQKIEIQQQEKQVQSEFYNDQLDENLEQLQEKLEKLTPEDDRFEIIHTLKKIAIAYDAQGKYFKALEYYQKAFKNAKKNQDSENIIAILNKIGVVYSQLGLYEQAIDYYKQVLKKNPPEKNNIFSNIGAIYRHLKKYSQALEYLRQALKNYQENQDNLGTAQTLNHIGVIYREQEKYSQALENHKQALAIQEEEGDQEGKAVTFHNIGKVYQDLNKYSESLKFLNHSLIIDRQLDNKGKEGIHLANLGKLLETKNQTELAIIFYKQSVNITESIRKNLKVLPAEEQEADVESVAETYRTLAELLLQKKRALEAHQIIDLLKVQEIFEQMGSLQIDNHKYSELPFLESEELFWKKYSQLIEAASDTKNQNQLEEKLLEIIEFFDSEEVKSIVSELKENAENQKLSSDIVFSLQLELKKHQKKNTVVLYPLVLEDRLELILVSSNSPAVHRTVSVTKQELNQALIELRVRLINRNNSQSLSNENNNQSDKRIMLAGFKLYNWLIKPLEKELRLTKAKTIIYAPDGQLRYIPLAALYDGRKWLVERFEINNITAASLMDLEPRENFQPVILAGALTEGSYQFQVGRRRFEFEGLPFAGVEVENIEQIFPETNKLLGNEFTKEAMELNMDSHNIVHFATHSAFVNGHPEESFILFGDGDRATLGDVKYWNLKDVELVVLSACQTALGKDIGNGQEILGFGYRVQEAGAAATLATLWLVDDQATHEFMNYFYVALNKGLSKVESLREAQVNMINSEYNHPYYWAPFILIGNGF